MTEAKHTPGPWSRNIPPAIKYPVIFAGRNTHVAQVKAGVEKTPEEIEANCNLIAAAPELLEALQQIVRYSDKSTDPGIISVARAAIAKATGAA